MPPASLASADDEVKRRVDRLFFDVDDTLTWRGQLPEVAAAALYKARAAGLSLIAVTGRSFSWAEMLMRLFPLDAAVAETGACALIREIRAMSGSGALASFLDVIHTEPDVLVRRANDAVRMRACDRVLQQVSAARLALDNAGRLYDSAFDLVESGPRVSDDDAARIRALLHEEGLTTAQSSVHINAWRVGPHGPFDKATMVDRLLRERFATSLDKSRDAICYVGDSENDGAMFARAGLSVGVGNVKPHLAALEAQGRAPRFIVDGSGGHGFAQVVNALIDARL